MPYLDSLDIANRANQYLGQPHITDVTDTNANTIEASFGYDKVRRAELQRNVWRFALRKAQLRAIDSNTLSLNPSLWSSTATYLFGAVVRDTNGVMWRSRVTDNLNNSPGGNNAAWDAYFGPLSVHLWDSTQSYNAGELVYKLGATAGSYTAFMSLINGNSDVPDVATAWDATVTYHFDDVVSNGGSQWRSLLANNLNVTPADGPLGWDATATYSSGQTVTGSDQFIYTSSTNGNTGNDPTTDNAVHWTKGAANGWSRTPTIPVSSKNWLVVGTNVLAPMSVLYPLGAGPSTQVTTRNLFRLPAGYLRHAHQAPKVGAVSILGAPGQLPSTDWEFDSEFIVTQEVGPIILRFVADVTVVTRMDDMFCEGLACRLALAMCESLTQSSTKAQTIASQYEKFMGDARKVNAIEEGSEEPPLDDWIACRA